MRTFGFSGADLPNLLDEAAIFDINRRILKELYCIALICVHVRKSIYCARLKERIRKMNIQDYIFLFYWTNYRRLQDLTNLD